MSRRLPCEYKDYCEDKRCRIGLCFLEQEEIKTQQAAARERENRRANWVRIEREKIAAETLAEMMRIRLIPRGAISEKDIRELALHSEIIAEAERRIAALERMPAPDLKL